jgi:hypothetical protein
MKVLLGFCGIVCLAFPTPAGSASLLQQEHSFTINLNASVASATPLFGPVRETEWAPDWKPHFLHPVDGAQREGVVFETTSGNGKTRVWLLTRYEVRQGRVEYAIVAPGVMAKEIKIHLSPDGARRCRATILYRHSALSLEGNEEVAKLTSNWAEAQRVHWQMAVNAVLEKKGRHD